jgi:hypothetical protein
VAMSAVSCGMNGDLRSEPSSRAARRGRPAPSARGDGSRRVPNARSAGRRAGGPAVLRCYGAPRRASMTIPHAIRSPATPMSGTRTDCGSTSARRSGRNPMSETASQDSPRYQGAALGTSSTAGGATEATGSWGGEERHFPTWRTRVGARSLDAGPRPRHRMAPRAWTGADACGARGQRTSTQPYMRVST